MKSLKIAVGILLCLPFLGWAGLRSYNSIIFNRNIGGHLKRAADSNSIELAKQELKLAIDQIEAGGLTHGYTSVLYNTPDEDVGFWCTNIKSCLNQINELPPVANQGEKDLVLMKLRQTLLDHKDGHEVETVPSGISVFPYNIAICVLGWLSAILATLGAVVVFIGLCD